MKVKCIDDELSDGMLILGSIYNAEEYSATSFRFPDGSCWIKSRFEIIKEENK